MIHIMSGGVLLEGQGVYYYALMSADNWTRERVEYLYEGILWDEMINAE